MKKKLEWMHNTIAYHPLAVALAKVMLSEMKVNGKALGKFEVGAANDIAQRGSLTKRQTIAPTSYIQVDNKDG